MNHATIVLDGGQFEQALAVLDRERPSPPQLKRFLWLNRLVWATFFLTLTWLVVVRSPLGRLQALVLWAALASAASVPLLFMANLGLVGKLWRATRTERRLGMSKDLDALTARMGLRRRRALDWALGLLIPIGLVCAVFGIVGVLVEAGVLVEPAGLDSPSGEGDIFLVAFTLALFGLACLSLYPMERGKRRLGAIASLRAALLGSQRADDGAAGLGAVTYDRITDIERTQIVLARQESVAARSAGRGPEVAISLSRPFHESLAGLTPEDVSRVHRSLQTLLDGSRVDGSTDQVQSLAVPGTSLTIEFVRNLAAGEIRVVSLRSAVATAGVEAIGPHQDGLPR